MASKEYREVFSSRLRSLMNKSNFTQQEVANEIGVTRQSFASYLQGKAMPKENKIRILAKKFGVPEEYLLLFDDSREEVKKHFSITMQELDRKLSDFLDTSFAPSSAAKCLSEVFEEDFFNCAVKRILRYKDIMANVELFMIPNTNIYNGNMIFAALDADQNSFDSMLKGLIEQKRQAGITNGDDNQKK